jgi:hypothetical protein
MSRAKSSLTSHARHSGLTAVLPQTQTVQSSYCYFFIAQAFRFHCASLRLLWGRPIVEFRVGWRYWNAPSHTRLFGLRRGIR